MKKILVLLLVSSYAIAQQNTAPVPINKYSKPLTMDAIKGLRAAFQVLNSRVDSVKAVTSTASTPGPPGSTGAKGNTGATPTITVNSVSTLAYGSTPTVTNSGSGTAVQLDIAWPAGKPGTNGLSGNNGTNGAMALRQP